MKEELQTSCDYLASRCLESSGEHQKYTNYDLYNASLIFSHFLLDIIFTENQNLPKDKLEELATTTGEAIRELIRSSTGIDMHELVKKL
jgi:hypothetical protein